MTSAARVVLILPTATYRAAAFLAAAAALGVEVVVATEEAPPLASEMEDRAVVVDLEHPQRAAATIAAFTARVPVDAVLAVDDQGVLVAAHANELLGIAHNAPDAVAATRDKSVMRSVLAAWGVPQPDFRVVQPGADVAALALEVGLPCVVKPVSLAASTGVIRADTAHGAAAVAERVRAILAHHDRPLDEPLLVERFVAGREVSLEGLLRGGDLEVLALFDKPDPLDGPYFEETLYVTPSRLAPVQQRAVFNAAAAGCRALGLREGPVHAEVRVEGDEHAPQVWVLEVAARSIGGLCSRALRFGAGISLEEVILRHAVGLDASDLTRAEAASGVMMLPIPRSGVLQEVAGVEAASAVAGISGVEITVAPGRRVEALPEGGRYLGFLFAGGATPDAVEASLRQAHAALELTIVDEQPPASRERASAQGTEVTIAGGLAGRASR